MMTVRAKSRPRRGAAAVEFALLSPLLLVLLLGLWEVGRMVEAQQVINNAAREGARQGSSGKKSAAEVQAAVTNYIAASGFDTTGIVVTITNVTTGQTNADPRTYSHLDHFRIDVSLPFNNVRWILLNRFNTDPQSGYAEISPPETLTAESHWYSMKDEVLTVSFSPPIE
jgi:Flp pilus assembly protein TadG